MLNIPSTVKTLFKTDGVRKNFRVHFPNGELPDITNENIVSESVHFTESLCSRNVFKFGLAEGSVIEFETVDIPNMYGMMIECGIEIDLSSLSPAEISAIASGTWDGTYVSAGSSDIGYAYFRVPYGLFRVDSCPRDHQSMAHRKVKAYTLQITENESSQMQNNILSLLGVYTSYAMNPQDVYAACISNKDNSILTSLGYTSQDISFSTGSTVNRDLYAWTDYNGDPTKTIHLRVSGSQPKYAMFNNITDGIITVNYDESLYTALDTFFAQMHAKYDSVSSWHGNYNIYSSWGEVFPEMIYGYIETVGGSTYTTMVSVVGGRLERIPSDAAVAAFGRLPRKQYQPAARLQFFETLTIEEVLFESGGHSTVLDTHTFNLGTLTAKQWTNSSDLGIRLSVEPTLSDFMWGGTKLYSFTDGIDILEVLQGYAELNASFVMQGRSGDPEAIRLDDTSPQTVLPGEYSSFWWDEYDVLPIGTVIFPFTQKQQKSVMTYQFGEGPSVYDMSENGMLESTHVSSPGTITALLDSCFVPYLDPIAFTPVDAELKGLPYIEAGDYLAIYAEDGSVAYTFAMQHEVTGIQNLSSAVESVSGMIIKSEDT